MQRMVSATMRMITPAAPSERPSSWVMPRKCLSMCLPSEPPAILVICFLSIDMMAFVNGLVMAFRMSGGFSAEVRPGDALIRPSERLYR